MSDTNRSLTVDDLYAMSDDDLLKHELQAGVLVSEPLPGFRHGRIVATVTWLLGVHVRREDLGVVLTGDAGFVLARGPDTVRGPDVAFVSRERVEHVADPQVAFEGPPDLAVEVLSPSSTPASAHAKVGDYLAAGTRLVWVVDPVCETVTSDRRRRGRGAGLPGPRRRFLRRLIPPAPSAVFPTLTDHAPDRSRQNVPTNRAVTRRHRPRGTSPLPRTRENRTITRPELP